MQSLSLLWCKTPTSAMDGYSLVACSKCYCIWNAIAAFVLSIPKLGASKAKAKAKAASMLCGESSEPAKVFAQLRVFVCASGTGMLQSKTVTSAVGRKW